MSKKPRTFGQLPAGATFMRNGLPWRKEQLPSGHNARYMGGDQQYFSAEFKDFQEVSDTPEQQDKDAEVAEWVGQHHMIMFAALSQEQKQQWRERYELAQRGDDQ